MSNSDRFDGNDGADDEDTDGMESDGGDDKLFLPIFNETSTGGDENVINDKSQFYDPFKVFKYLGDKIMGNYKLFFKSFFIKLQKFPLVYV